ncbi:short-chain dehydrogenase reductase sdr [Moniliophthora roreri]|nr:short-chain dehydrogenase reductase sdr [Moniliophthora roreri]
MSDLVRYLNSFRSFLIEVQEWLHRLDIHLLEVVFGAIALSLDHHLPPVSGITTPSTSVPLPYSRHSSASFNCSRRILGKLLGCLIRVTTKVLSRFTLNNGWNGKRTGFAGSSIFDPAKAVLNPPSATDIVRMLNGASSFDHAALIPAQQAAVRIRFAAQVEFPFSLHGNEAETRK